MRVDVWKLGGVVAATFSLVISATIANTHTYQLDKYFLPRDATQRAVLLRQVVRLSVFP